MLVKLYGSQLPTAQWTDTLYATNNHTMLALGKFTKMAHNFNKMFETRYNSDITAYILFDPSHTIIVDMCGNNT